MNINESLKNIDEEFIVEFMDEEDNNDSTDKSVAEIANEKASKLYTSAKEFILENKKSVGIGIGVLVLVIAGIVGFVVYKKRKLSLS